MRYTKKEIDFGVIQCDPLPSESELNHYYAKKYYKTSESQTYHQTYPERELANKNFRATLLLHACKNHLSSCARPRVLELGAGEGFFMAACLKEGFSVTGIDFQAEQLMRFNPTAAPSFVEASPLDYLTSGEGAAARYDLVMLQNVLEHVREPNLVLDLVKDRLTECGVVCIQVPNDNSDFQKYAKQEGRLVDDTWFSPPDHITYWNVGNFEVYLSDHGFELKDIFGDFPIEMFQWGAEGSYGLTPGLGKFAHQGRVAIEAFINRHDVDSVLDFYRSAAKIGLARNMAAVIQVK